MRCGSSWSLGVVVVAGCWSDEPTIHGFTPAQWSHLQAEFTPGPIDPCKLTLETLDTAACAAAADLGQQLFYEPLLSGNGMVSCATCHDPKRSYVDSRPGPLSLGVNGLTRRNTVSVLNLAHKAPDTFTWIGEANAIDVMLDVAFPRAMASTPTDIAVAINSHPTYLQQLRSAFGTASSDVIILDVASALEAYMNKIVAFDAPFDHFIAGDPTALDESAARGFTLFAGRAMCIECHRGPLFTDDKFRVTGVIGTDDGRALITMAPEDRGKFLTPSLRNVAMTAPYMHTGAYATLADVIELYRWGGESSGYRGDKDPLMEPLELSEQDMLDLEAFMRSLTSPIPEHLSTDIRDL